MRKTNGCHGHAIKRRLTPHVALRVAYRSFHSSQLFVVSRRCSSTLYPHLLPHSTHDGSMAATSNLRHEMLASSLENLGRHASLLVFYAFE